MVKNTNLLLLMIAVVLLPKPCCSQSNEGRGSLIGTVICTDSAKPARFAIVRVTKVVDAKEPQMMQSATTDYNGVFTMSGLLPGEYRIDPIYPGYVSNIVPLSGDAHRGSDATQDSNPVLIAADKTSVFQVMISPGSSVSGRVMYDDGTPGVLLRVEAIAISETKLAVSGGTPGTVSPVIASAPLDDRGFFRLSGLSPGRYLIRVTFPAQGFMPVYLGDTSNPVLATSISVLNAEDFSIADIHLPAKPILMNSSKL